MKLFKWFLGLENEDKKIWYWGFILLILIVIAQYKYGIHNQDSFWTSLLPNFFADTISILITTYLLAKILEKREGTRKKKEAYMIFGEEYTILVQTISRRYIWHITKTPSFSNEKNSETENEDNYDDEDDYEDDNDDDEDYAEDVNEPETGLILEAKVIFKGEDHESTIILNSTKAINQSVGERRDKIINKLEDTIATVNKHIGKDFLITKYMETYGEEGRDYLEFGRMFKMRSLEDINELKEKYFQFMPSDLLISFIKLENYLNSQIVHIGGDIESIDKVLLEKTKFNVNEFREIFTDMGKEILFLMNYFREFEDKTIKKL